MTPTEPPPRPTNRSAPVGPVIPVLSYPDVRGAVDWLVGVLGFAEKVWIGPNHRAQLEFGGGALIVADTGSGRAAPGDEATTHAVMLRVDDIDDVCERVRRNGATVVREPEDLPFGERQCQFVDPGGHRWTLTQTVRDVAPEAWGGTTGPG